MIPWQLISERFSVKNVEEWADVAGYCGAYQVSSFGRVRSTDRVVNSWCGGRLARGRELRAHKTSSGYPSVVLSRKGLAKTVPVHRLVIETFGTLGPHGPECRHLDGDKTNNFAENLAWGTKSDNAADRDQHGTTAIGERHGKAKMSEFGVRVVRRLLDRGAMSCSEIGGFFGVTSGCISSIKNGQTWGWLNV